MPRYQLAPVHNGQVRWNTATTVDTIPLTPRQLRLLDYLRAYLASHGHTPAHRQNAVAIGLPSTASVNHQLHRRQTRGHARRSTRRTRAWNPAGHHEPTEATALTVVAHEPR